MSANPPQTATHTPSTFVPPLRGADLLKRESIVRILQHREMAEICDLPAGWLDATLIAWLVRHVPARILAEAARCAQEREEVN